LQIFENPTLGGITTVFSVKGDSIISDKVKEVDRLISVNGIDTTELSARNVSKNNIAIQRY